MKITTFMPRRKLPGGTSCMKPSVGHFIYEHSRLRANRYDLSFSLARRVAALQSADAGLGGQTDVDEDIENDGE